MASVGEEKSGVKTTSSIIQKETLWKRWKLPNSHDSDSANEQSLSSSKHLISRKMLFGCNLQLWQQKKTPHWELKNRRLTGQKHQKPGQNQGCRWTMLAKALHPRKARWSIAITEGILMLTHWIRYVDAFQRLAPSKSIVRNARHWIRDVDLF